MTTSYDVDIVVKLRLITMIQNAPDSQCIAKHDKNYVKAWKKIIVVLAENRWIHSISSKIVGEIWKNLSLPVISLLSSFNMCLCVEPASNVYHPFNCRKKQNCDDLNIYMWWFEYILVIFWKF